MGTRLIGFNKNPNIGLYVFATDKYLLVGKEINQKSVEELEELFKVPVHKINIAGTSLLGVFISGTEELLLIPSITLESEKKELEKLGLNYKVFETDLTCLGNNIIMNENGVLVNPDFSNQEIKTLKNIFDLPVKKISIANTETPGACIVIRNKKALIHRDAATAEIKEIEKILKVKTIPSTINMGVPYMKSGIICNDQGLAIGELSGPAEIMNAEEGLGFIDG
ncbi:MAG: translation initiation factor IF-6 [Nanoarchaeota archaeon]|nr:translation initiation factor IF-6 [Nanoarchaeota archaeon]MBU1854758.1 translation initiation factor IF-6 [Nanoarchaeota archaeon]